jgi:hypothetical protein
MICKLLAVAAAALSLGGCATEQALTPVVDASQNLSKQLNGVVRVAAPSTAVGGRMTLGVVAFNVSPMEAILGTENVRVFTAAGTPVRVFTHEELVKEAKSAAAWQTFTVALSGAANGSAVSQPTTISTYGSAYNSMARYTKLSGRETDYSPLNAALTGSINDPQTSRTLSQISTNLDSTLNNLGSRFLSTTRVGPGNAVGGNVVIDSPKFAKGEQQVLRVVVTFHGEEHEFKFSVG